VSRPAGLGLVSSMPSNHRPSAARRWMPSIARCPMLRVSGLSGCGITHSPPANWDLERKQEYFAWAARVVDGCRGVNPWLEMVFDQAHRDGLARLAADE